MWKTLGVLKCCILVAHWSEGRWFDPRSLPSACQSVLGRGIEWQNHLMTLFIYSRARLIYRLIYRNPTFPRERAFGDSGESWLILMSDRLWAWFKRFCIKILQLFHNKTQPRNTNKYIFLFWYSRVLLLWPSISTQARCIVYSKGVQFNWYHSDCNNHITTSWVNTCWEICHHIVKAMWSCGGMRPRWTNAGTPIFAAKVNAQITLEKTNRDEKKIYWKSQVAVQVEKVTYLLDFFPFRHQ